MIGRNFVEGYAHAESGLGVDNRAIGFEGVAAFFEGDLDAGADGKRDHGVDEAAAGAEVGGASGKARAGGTVNNFGGGGEEMTRRGAALIVRNGAFAFRGAAFGGVFTSECVVGLHAADDEGVGERRARERVRGYVQRGILWWGMGK